MCWGATGTASRGRASPPPLTPRPTPHSLLSKPTTHRQQALSSSSSSSSASSSPTTSPMQPLQPLQQLQQPPLRPPTPFTWQSRSRRPPTTTLAWMPSTPVFQPPLQRPLAPQHSSPPTPSPSQCPWPLPRPSAHPPRSSLSAAPPLLRAREALTMAQPSLL